MNQTADREDGERLGRAFERSTRSHKLDGARDTFDVVFRRIFGACLLRRFIRENAGDNWQNCYCAYGKE